MRAEYHTTKLSTGDKARGYVTLISKDGGASQEFYFSYAPVRNGPIKPIMEIQNIIRPYQKHTGQVIDSITGTSHHYPVIEMSLQDSIKTAKMLAKWHHNVHVFHAEGTVSHINITSKQYWAANLVNVSDLTITEEERYYYKGDLAFTLNCDQCGAAVKADWLHSYTCNQCGHEHIITQCPTCRAATEVNPWDGSGVCPRGHEFSGVQ